MTRILPGPILLLLLAALWFAGELRGAETADPRPAIDAVLRFIDALQAGDAQALRDSIWAADGSRAQQLGRELFIQLVLAQRRLEQAASERFGSDADRFRTALSQAFTAADRQAMLKATVIFDDVRFCRVVKPDETWYMRLRRDAGGGWRVTIETIDLDLDDDPNAYPPRPDSVSQMRLEARQELLRIVEEAARRISSGELASAEVAENELLRQIASLRADFRQRMSRLPERFRWVRQPW